MVCEPALFQDCHVLLAQKELQIKGGGVYEGMKKRLYTNKL
jgi:hypothetical protein